jgi:hypothetical protein
MRTLTAQELLALAELRDGLPVSAQALALLSAACPEMEEADLLRMSLGDRDVRLMQLREKTFGAEIQALAVCPACGQQLDVPLRLPDLFAEAVIASGETYSCSAGGYEIRFQCPTVADLPGVFMEPDSAPPRLNLLKRCVREIRRGDLPIPAEELPEPVAAALVSSMAEADPMAEVRLAVACPDCGNTWMEDFDIASYFLKELNTEAQALLREVHLLASEYGWAEGDILNLSASRRNAYLELIMQSKG